MSASLLKKEIKDTRMMRMLLEATPGLGPVLSQGLIEHAGSVEALLQYEPQQFDAAGLSPQIVRSLFDSNVSEGIRSEIALAHEHGIRILTPEHTDYPASFRVIAHPPHVLYVQGKLPAFNRSIAMVGTRKPSKSGLRNAKRFAHVFARKGLNIVSGLARGIDTASHQASLDAKGATTAVLGSGLLCPYPRENRRLAQEIAQTGCLVSEFRLQAEPETYHFPRRNRLIAAFSKAVVIVEAPLKSGALITADSALEQGKEVYAIPGDLLTPSASGSNRLIQDGAFCLTDPSQVLHQMGVEDTQSASRTIDEEFMSSYEPRSFDELKRASGLSPSQLLQRLSEWEMKGLVMQERGHWIRKQ